MRLGLMAKDSTGDRPPSLSLSGGTPAFTGANRDLIIGSVDHWSSALPLAEIAGALAWMLAAAVRPIRRVDISSHKVSFQLGT